MYKILFVDDEKEIRENFCKMFRWSELGMDTPITAENGEDAIRLVSIVNPDIIITDICMPSIGGLELLKYVRQNHPHIKTVILSGHSEFEYARKGMEYGASAYLLKSFDKDDFIQVFKKLFIELEMKREQIIQFASYLTNREIFNEKYMFLYRLLKGEIKAREVDAQAKKVALNIIIGKTCCALYEIKSDHELKEELMSSVYGKLEKYICGKYSNRDIKYENIHIDMHKVAFIISSRHHIHNQVLKTLISDIREYIYEETKIPILCGIGKTYESIDNISKSYSDAIKALKMSYYNDDNKEGAIFDINDYIITEPDSLMEKYISESEKRIIDGLLTWDDDQLCKNICKYVDYFKEKKLEPGYLVEKCYQLTLLIKITLISLNVEGIASEEKLQMPYKSFADCKSFDEFRKMMLDFISAISVRIYNYNEIKRCGNGLKNVLDYIEQHYNEKINLDKASKLIYMNPNYFCVYFKEKTKMNFTDYVNKIRINKAKNMLENSTYKINIIAEKVGFNDTSYFCNIFKKIIGTTPLEYRKHIILDESV